MSKKRQVMVIFPDKEIDAKAAESAKKKRRQIPNKKKPIERSIEELVATTVDPSEDETSNCIDAIDVILKHEISEDVVEKCDTLTPNTVQSESVNSCDKCLYCSDHCPQSSIDKRRLECSKCRENGLRRSFATQEKLDDHIKSAHDVEDGHVVFVCRECEEPPLVFKSKTKYMYHLGSKHPGAIYFVCEICAATFKLKANYREHMSSHNIPSKKAFTCDVCKGTFVNKAGFESHKKRFPGPHIKHVCKHCNFSFSKESHMQNHRCKKLLFEEAAVRASVSVEDELPVASVDSPPASLPVVTEPQYYRTVTVANIGDPIQDGQQDGSEQVILRGVTATNQQILQFDLDEGVVSNQVYQVNVADWNIVAPFIIRDHAERPSE